MSFLAEPSKDSKTAGGRSQIAAVPVHLVSALPGKMRDEVHNLAERGGRVFHVAPVAVKQAKPIDAGIVVAALTVPRPESTTTILRSIPKALEAKVAAETIPRKPQPNKKQPRDKAANTGALALLAAFEPRPTENRGLTGTAIAAYQAPADIARPSLRPGIDVEIATQSAEPAESGVMASVPVPASRPDLPEAKPVRVASLEPQDMPGPLGTVTDDMTALAIPLPESRPDYQPPVVATPQPQAQPVQRPAQRQVPQRAPAAVASTPPSAPSSGGSFFERLFKGGSSSAKLPPAHLGVAVYDISAQTVYLPGDGKLEAHSGLGHMQDNARYVAQKNRGPTPPNVYNLRMREARFHGAEAIRLLPADGRKKYNRDGLLAHPYMYIGGGDRSQSNGCVVFKNYDRFLAAFKRGHVKKMIVVSSMDELPTYMAAL